MAGPVPGDDQYALIVGAMKSGTSALFDLMAQHPQVCPSKVKEPEYFSERQGHGLRVDRYADLWEFDPSRHRVAMEASTGYAKYPSETGVPQRISAAGLQPRFIYVLRHPVERISSQVVYGTWGRKGAVADFANPEALAISRYAEQLEQFTAVFPRERFLLIDHGALAVDPVGVAATVQDFLGLDPVALAPPEAPKNAARPRSDWERRLMARGPLARVATAAPDSVKSRLRRASGSKAAARPVMTAEVAERLFDALADDMARLHAQWGFDVAQWGFGPQSSREAS